MEYNNLIYINNTIFYNKSGFTIEPNQILDSRDNNSIILNILTIFFTRFRYIRNKNRLNIFRKQLLNNLPKVITNPNDLYIIHPL
jgi:hypothetical protein